MRTQEYLPEVARNRWRTNWVVERAQSGMPKPKVHKRLGYISIGLISSIFTLGLTCSLIPNSPKPSAYDEQANHLSSDRLPNVTHSDCSVVGLLSALPDTPADPIRSGHNFTQSLSAFFGGVSVTKYACLGLLQTRIFRVTWTLTSSRHWLKEISQPPSR